MPRVSIVVFDGFQSLDAFGPLEVFSGAGYGVELASLAAGPVRASNGATVVANRAIADIGHSIDTLLVAGGEGTRNDALLPTLAEAVGSVAPRARRVASVCTGAFVLAAAGLLDGRRCTTHWAHATTLARRYPSLRVEPDSIFVRDGEIWTSAGVTAGIDLALALVEQDRGSELARKIARHLVVYLQRPGGQRQFSAAMSVQTANGHSASAQAMRDLVVWIREHVDADCSVAALARRAGMSQRSLARAFRNELGTTPADLVECCRIEVARQLLETTDLTVAAIAGRTGIGAPETLHRAFARRLQTTPAEYRDRFRGRSN
jgi:transcriptional regulator GlxA family with amidase domain